MIQPKSTYRSALHTCPLPRVGPCRGRGGQGAAAEEKKRGQLIGLRIIGEGSATHVRRHNKLPVCRGAGRHEAVARHCGVSRDRRRGPRREDARLERPLPRAAVLRERSVAQAHRRRGGRRRRHCAARARAERRVRPRRHQRRDRSHPRRHYVRLSPARFHLRSPPLHFEYRSYDSIAKAFGLSLKQHNDTIEKMKAIAHARDPSTPFDLNTGRLRMATLPHPATVSHPCKDLWVPIVTVNGNVSIFPGVPRLFEQLVSNFVQDSIVPSVPGLKQFYRMQIGTPKMESEIADVLTAWQKQVDPVGIKIGSYPKWAPETVVDTEGVSRSMRVVVSVVGQDQDAVEKTIAGIQSDLDAFRVKL